MIVPLTVSVLAAFAIVEVIVGHDAMRVAVAMRRRLIAHDHVDRSVHPRGRVVEAARSRRTVRRSERSIPDLLDGVVRRLRSGATLRHSLERTASTSTDPIDRRLADDLHTGSGLRPSLARWRGGDDEPNRRLAAVAVDLAASAGGASARVLDGVAETLRDRVALDREVTALSTQARASAAVLVVAPIGFALLAISIDHRLLAVMASPIGVVCLVLGLSLDAIGAWWMRKLVRAR